MIDDMDDADERRERIERYAWQPGEREAAMAELERRERQIQRERIDELLARPKPSAAAEPQPAARAEPTRSWSSWVRSEVKRAIKANTKNLLAAIGDVLGEERRAHEKAVAELRARIEQLEARSVAPPQLRAVGE
jgi:U3 small nucleolar ribonucleoprotein component